VPTAPTAPKRKRWVWEYIGKTSSGANARESEASVIQTKKLSKTNTINNGGVKKQSERDAIEQRGKVEGRSKINKGCGCEKKKREVAGQVEIKKKKGAGQGYYPIKMCALKNEKQSVKRHCDGGRRPRAIPPGVWRRGPQKKRFAGKKIKLGGSGQDSQSGGRGVRVKSNIWERRVEKGGSCGGGRDRDRGGMTIVVGVVRTGGARQWTNDRKIAGMIIGYNKDPGASV